MARPGMQQLELTLQKLRSIGIGKWVGNVAYCHRSVDSIPKALPPQVARLADEILSSWNVLKVSPPTNSISFLEYLDFDEADHPYLIASLTVHLDKQQSRLVRYNTNGNPPILHRKELLVDTEYPGRTKWLQLTADEEASGLYDEPHRIGFLVGWRSVQKKKGWIV